jgi:hypothetical protein
MPRRIRDFALAAFGVALLVGALAMLDERVPAHVMGAARDVSAGRIAAPGPVAQVMVDIASNPALDDAFLFAMAGAGVILVILMLRT